MSETNTIPTTEEKTTPTTETPITPAPEKKARKTIPKADPAEDAAKHIEDTEAAKKAAKDNLASALKRYGQEWLTHDDAEREWLYRAGEMTVDALAYYCDVHGWGHKERAAGIEAICASVLNATGEVRNKDISRALGIFHAASYFNRKDHSRARQVIGSRFLSLPITAQKGFALLFKRDNADVDGRTAEVWSLIQGPKITEGKEEREDMTEHVWALLALCFAECASPPHLKGKINRVRLTGKSKKAKQDVGTAHGYDVYKIASDLLSYCRGKGKNPLVETVAPKGKATTSGTPPLTTPRGPDGATGGRPEGSKGGVNLDTKPALASGQIVEALAGHDDGSKILFAMGKNPEVTADGFICSVIFGMVEAKRVNELKKIRAYVMSALKKLNAID